MRLILFVCAVLLGCTSLRATAHPETLYTSFGVAAPAVDQEIIERWKADRELLIRNARAPETVIKTSTGRKTTVAELAGTKIEAVNAVEVLVDSVPEGIELDRGSARAAPSSGYEVLGHFSMRYRDERPLSEALDDVKVLTNAAGGNLTIITWQRSSQKSARGVVGLVFKRDTRTKVNRETLRSGKVSDI
jgi:hypothetical protein